MTLLTNTIKDQAGGSTITVPTGGTFTIGSGRTLLLETVASGAASVIFGSAYITSSYDIYEMEVIGGTVGTDGAAIWMRAGTDGSALLSTSIYSWNYAAVAAQILPISSSVGNASAEGFCMYNLLFSPSSTAKYKNIISLGVENEESTVTGGTWRGGAAQTATAVNVWGILPSTGTMSGTFRLFGRSKT